MLAGLVSPQVQFRPLNLINTQGDRVTDPEA